MHGIIFYRMTSQIYHLSCSRGKAFISENISKYILNKVFVHDARLVTQPSVLLCIEQVFVEEGHGDYFERARH